MTIGIGCRGIDRDLRGASLICGDFSGVVHGSNRRIAACKTQCALGTIDGDRAAASVRKGHCFIRRDGLFFEITYNDVEENIFVIVVLVIDTATIGLVFCQGVCCIRIGFFSTDVMIIVAILFGIIYLPGPTISQAVCIICRYNGFQGSRLTGLDPDIRSVGIC